MERQRAVGAVAQQVVLLAQVHPGGGLPPGHEDPEPCPALVADAQDIGEADDASAELRGRAGPASPQRPPSPPAPPDDLLEEPSCLTRHGFG